MHEYRVTKYIWKDETKPEMFDYNAKYHVWRNINTAYQHKHLSGGGAMIQEPSGISLKCCGGTLRQNKQMTKDITELKQCCKEKWAKVPPKPPERLAR